MTRCLRLGGHAETYVDTASGVPINIGVVVFENVPLVNGYFSRVPQSSMPSWARAFLSYRAESPGSTTVQPRSWVRTLCMTQTWNTLPADLSLQKVGDDTPYHLPPLPAIYGITPTGAPNLWNFKFGSSDLISDRRARRLMLQSLH